MAREFLWAAYRKALHKVSKLRQPGQNVFEEEWDVLLVVDGCRLDLFEEAVRDGTFPFGNGRSIWSLDSMTRAWMQKTFVESYASELERTHYICGNPFSSEAIDGEQLASLDETWRYHWDDEVGTIHPRPLTDRAIALARRLDPERLVVHYMQPHHPFVPDPLDGDGGLARTGRHSNTANPWVALRRGEVSADRVWNAYEANLRYVLREVEALAENVDGRIAVTADHGNLFGEWGLYGHPMHTPVPALLAVPWAETDGVDSGEREPDLRPPEPLPVSRVYGAESDRDRLDSLGYL